MEYDEMYIYVADILKSTATDGDGLRNALYVSGCSIRCEGCHNKQFWEIESGKRMKLSEVYDELNEDRFNISILGGEPLMQYEQILALCMKIKEETNKTIWMWSGYTVETIRKKFPKILDYIDVLVDGPFIQSQYEPNLKFVGSRNQRIIHLK